MFLFSETLTQESAYKTSELLLTVKFSLNLFALRHWRLIFDVSKCRIEVMQVINYTAFHFSNLTSQLNKVLYISATHSRQLFLMRQQFNKTDVASTDCSKSQIIKFGQTVSKKIFML